MRGHNVAIIAGAGENILTDISCYAPLPVVVISKSSSLERLVEVVIPVPLPINLFIMWIITAFLLQFIVVAARLVGIPTVPFTESGNGSFSLASVKSIVVDSKYAETTDDRGQTLIPPTLQEFATTFAADWEVTMHSSVDVVSGDDGASDAIFLTIGDAGDYLDAASQETSEGYTLSVSSSGITIAGASPLGVWWGTRTILQQLVLAGGSFPYGSTVDSPGWETRGMMLDAGRHYYPPEFLVELCSYMSFFKQNTFHLHLSDNVYNNPNYTREQSLELYARFRLWSDSPAVEGLNKHQNESYTQEEFDQVRKVKIPTSCDIFLSRASKASSSSAI